MNLARKPSKKQCKVVSFLLYQQLALDEAIEKDRSQNMQDVMGFAKDFKFNSLKYTKYFSLEDF